MKHKGNFFTALSDSEMIQKIVTFQNSSLTDWSVEECLELNNAFLKFGKRFEAIRHFCYPHKTTKSLVNTYYIWKTSPLYQQYRSLVRIQNKYFIFYNFCQKSKDEETTEETEIPVSVDCDSKPPSICGNEHANLPTYVNGNNTINQSPY
ncbi:hypothetical protein MXB_1443 [Myxobolus squamalis]|nr:hypothetical protein MXB_1443 [Myxobolus squamalis]